MDELIEPQVTTNNMYANRLVYYLLGIVSSLVKSGFMVPVIIFTLLTPMLIIILLTTFKMDLLAGILSYPIIFLSGATKIGVTTTLNTADFLRSGWRMIFIFSVVYNVIRFLRPNIFPTRTFAENVKRAIIFVVSLWVVNVVAFVLTLTNMSTAEAYKFVYVGLAFFTIHMVFTLLCVTISGGFEYIRSKFI